MSSPAHVEIADSPLQYRASAHGAGSRCSRLARQGIEAVVPGTQELRDYIQTAVRDELGRGIVSAYTRNAYLEIIQSMVAAGCEGVIFGCTEIPLLLKQEDLSVPCFDTTKIHSEAGIRFLIGSLRVV